MGVKPLDVTILASQGHGWPVWVRENGGWRTLGFSESAYSHKCGCPIHPQFLRGWVGAHDSRPSESGLPTDVADPLGDETASIA